MLIRRQFINVNEQKYLVSRILKDFTTEELAQSIHEELNTDTLLKDGEGRWYCCFKVQEGEFRDLTEEELIALNTPIEKEEDTPPPVEKIESGIGTNIDTTI